MYNTKVNTRYLIYIISIMIFIIIGINIRASNEGILFDDLVMEYIHKRINPLYTTIMKGITYFGSVYFFLPMGIAIFIYMSNKNNFKGRILLLLSILGSYALNSLFKNIFIRIRPLKYFLIEQGGYSFPSGHSMVSMTFYTTMIHLINKNIKNQNWKVVLWILNSLIILLIGISRIYLGVHWPSDVIMGYLIGYLFYRITIFFE